MDNLVEFESKMRKRGRWLCRAGWAAFAISLALPAVHVLGWLSGWECFREVFDVMARLPQQPSGAGFYYSGFALANLVLLASPVFLRIFRRDLRWLRRGSLALTAATAYAALYPVTCLASDWKSGIADFHIGYYVWVLSFSLVTAGAMHLSMRRSINVAGRRTSTIGRTEEDLAAIRELEEYLTGGGGPVVDDSHVAGSHPKTADNDAVVGWLAPDIEDRPRLAPGERFEIRSAGLETDR